MKKILFVIGTRPEIIKTAPVIAVFKEDSRYRVNTCFTGQHRAMALQMVKDFGIKLDYDLDLMRPGQSLNYVASASIARLDKVYERFKPDMVFVQGDTTTAFCAGLAAFQKRIKVAHIEAGLRTYDKYAPYPEEMNRTLLSRIADLHFAPTIQAKNNLLKEGVERTGIVVTGNTVIDALFFILGRKKGFNSSKLKNLPKNKKIILVTAHRRENFGKPILNICQALKDIARKNNDVLLIYPVHLNPNILTAVKKALSGIDNILLIEPVDYSDFAGLMAASYLILTDSGGVQEEAPSLKKPVLVLRDNTERPEVVRAGCAKLVGTSVSAITNACRKLLVSKSAYRKMCVRKNPIGDGKASLRIKRRIDEIYF